ncbi:hypothetical protein FRC00_000971, partial [Tulasnella sp. 408]
METSAPASRPERLTFFGKDSDECENFIADVMMHAYDEGKQKDDEWIAEWSYSRKLGASSKGFVLEIQSGIPGESGEEAEKFVFSIRQRAHDVGKLEDPQWIATFAAAFFAGNALRWYSSLQIKVQKDWDALQRAIFIQYPQVGKD